MQNISIGDVEQIAFELARRLMSYNEPIPDYCTRFPNVLESCLAAPFQWFGGRSLYRGLISKSSLLFYLMIKNHPFQNGNKRIAIMTMIYFLHINGRWLKIDSKRLYNFSKWVASSDPILKDQVISSIEEILKKYTIKNNT